MEVAEDSEQLLTVMGFVVRGRRAGSDENVLGLDSSDSYTTLRIYYEPLNYLLF